MERRIAAVPPAPAAGVQRSIVHAVRRIVYSAWKPFVELVEYDYHPI
jgi:hypothetical protein